jgi:hypothetical protein
MLFVAGNNTIYPMTLAAMSNFETLAAAAFGPLPGDGPCFCRVKDPKTPIYFHKKRIDKLISKIL